MQVRSIVSLSLLFLLSFAGMSRADEAAAIAEVEKAGGTVRPIAKDSDEKEAAFHLSSTEVNDASLVKLKEIPKLIWLNLRGTKITDAGLASVAEVKSLTQVHLERTAVTDAGLAHLAGLENLEYLNLYDTKVTNAGLEQLKNLKKLKKLYVWQTGVTKEGAAKLKESLPELYVNLGAEAEPSPPTKALAMGRYVRIRLEGEKRTLSLAEVQIIETASGKELQKGAKASQSSNFSEAVADRAVDGNVEGKFEQGSVTHTNEETNPWWLVDLGDTQDIGKIVVHNRSDCCGDRLKDAVVEVIDRSLTPVYTGKIAEVKDGSVTELVAP